MKKILLLLSLISVFAPLFSQELLPVEINGEPDNMINIVVVAEGYTTADKNAFNVHVAQFVDEIFSDPVLANYRSYHNIYGFFVESVESGSDDPLAGIYRNTYFDSTVDHGKIMA